MPVREVLERADGAKEIDAEDFVHSPAQAVLDYLASDSADSSGREALRVGLLAARDVLQARMSAVPAERQAALAEILAAIDREIERAETGESRT